MKDENIEKLLKVLLTSAIGGAIIGLLMAPKKELTTREKLSKEGGRYRKEITDMISEIRQFVDSKSKTAKADVEATKNDLDELSDDAKGKGEDLLKRAKKLLSYGK